MPEKVPVVRVGKEFWVNKEPVALVVHTATELPERTQLADRVLRSSQSRNTASHGEVSLTCLPQPLQKRHSMDLRQRLLELEIRIHHYHRRQDRWLHLLRRW